MIIVVEGIDRVGKTTLCNRLSEELNIPIYKHSQHIVPYAMMDNLNETDKMLHMLEMCNLSKTDVIFDRFHMSDYAYGMLERGYDARTATRHLILIDDMLKQLDAIVILTRPTDIYESSQQHGKDLTAYQALMDNAFDLLRSKKYACKYDTMTDAIKFVKEALDEKSRL